MVKRLFGPDWRILNLRARELRLLFQARGKEKTTRGLRASYHWRNTNGNGQQTGGYWKDCRSRIYLYNLLDHKAALIKETSRTMRGWQMDRVKRRIVKDYNLERNMQMGQVIRQLNVSLSVM